jgi:hypothetical protein
VRSEQIDQKEKSQHNISTHFVIAGMNRAASFASPPPTIDTQGPYQVHWCGIYFAAIEFNLIEILKASEVSKDTVALTFLVHATADSGNLDRQAQAPLRQY